MYAQSITTSHLGVTALTLDAPKNSRMLQMILHARLLNADLVQYIEGRKEQKWLPVQPK